MYDSKYNFNAIDLLFIRLFLTLSYDHTVSSFYVLQWWTHCT